MMVEETLSLCDTKFLINSKLNSGYEKKSRSIICSPSASFAAVYPVVNRYILQYCDLQDSRGGKVRELLDVKTIVTNPYRRCVGGFGRNINIFFLLAEAMWIAAGHKDVEFLTIFNKRMAEFSDDGVVFHAPYGWRLRHWGVPSEGCAVNQGLDQVTAAVRFLAEDPDTRQVVMSIWNPDLDLGAVTKDKPCNDMVMLKIREGKLITTIQNRSNDLHWGLPTNIFQFSFLTELMSICLGISLGVQTHNSQSLHIYEWNEIAKNMDNEYVKSISRTTLYALAVSYKMDFAFESEVPVNRMRELTGFLDEIIRRFTCHAHNEEMSDEAGYESYLQDKSSYFWAVYEMLKTYIVYKKVLKEYSKDEAIQIAVERLKAIVKVLGKEFANWDYMMLANNFFNARMSNSNSIELL